MTAAASTRSAISQGSRILAAQGVLDAFGHVSARHPDSSDRFLIPRSLAPALVTSDDVVELDLGGERTSASDDRPLFLERFIHGEIYRRRPDVGAVVHSHALPVLPFAVVPGARLRPVCHVCGFLEGSPAAFDLADHAGPSSNLLISSPDYGLKLAEHLGDANVVLMRSHGYTAVGASVEQAVFRAIYTMRNCEIDLAARALGQPAYLSAGEAEACDRTTNAVMSRAWELWVRDLPSVAPDAQP